MYHQYPKWGHTGWHRSGRSGLQEGVSSLEDTQPWSCALLREDLHTPRHQPLVVPRWRMMMPGLELPNKPTEIELCWRQYWPQKKNQQIDREIIGIFRLQRGRNEQQKTDWQPKRCAQGPLRGPLNSSQCNMLDGSHYP